MVNKSKMALAGVSLIAGAGLLIASTTNTGNDKKQKNKKYQVIHMENGTLVEFDTIIPMNSSYTVENFLSDKKVSSNNIEIIDLSSETAHFAMFIDENSDNKNGEHVIVKTKVVTTTDVNGDKNEEEIHQDVQIFVEKDDNGNITAKKIVNGKEVEMTEDEIQEMMSMHPGDKPHGDHENIMIKIDIDEDGNTSELMELINLDSIIKEVHKNVSFSNGEEGEMKVIVKHLSTETDLDGNHNVIIINNDGDKKEWHSKNGETVDILTTEDHEDFTIVIVTEDDGQSKPYKKSANITDPELDFSIFPNPSDGKFTLKFNQKNKKKTTIEVTDLRGKNVYSENLGKFSGEYQKEINLSKFGKGVYIVNILSGNKKTTNKVVIK